MTRAILDRIERLNPVLNAFTVVTAELALKQARAAERAYAAGDAPPLAGIPTSIKDLTPTRGIRTARGSLIDPDWVPEEDAPVVERLYAAGAVMLGKTNTPELGWKGDSGNRVFGPSFNPWNLAKTPGGSSGGAAAAVAAGLGPLAQGSDGAGSIRIPAAFCGIFGFKQSFGLVPQYPPSAVGDLSHLGPMTRTVRDAAMMLNAMAGADARDRLSWSSGIDYTRDLDAGVRGLRVAWSPTLGYAQVASDVLENTERAAMAFRELGCEVEQVDPDLPDPANILDVMWSGSMAGYFRGQARRGPPSPRSGIAGGDRARGVAIGRGHGARVATAQHLLHGNAPVHGFAAFRPAVDANVACDGVYGRAWTSRMAGSARPWRRSTGPRSRFRSI